MTAKVKAKAKPEADENRDLENLNANQQLQLDGALRDSFPASDPPSITQPGCLKPGGPEHKDSSWRKHRSR
jgi:hypothetical protein